MDNLFNIYNENCGKVVSTTGKYVAVSNPTSYNFNFTEGYSRIGEVLVYKLNEHDNSYSLHFKCTSSLSYLGERGLINQSAENISDICEEYGNGNIIRSNSLLYQSKAGTSLDTYNNLMVVGDYECIIEKEPGNKNSFIKFGRVDIYDLQTGNGDYKEPLFTIDPYTNIKSNLIRFGEKDLSYNNTYLNGFGYSVAINENYIYVGCPFATDTLPSTNIDDCHISPIENTLLRPTSHGVVFAYKYTFTNNTFSLVRDCKELNHRDYMYDPEIITPNELYYNNFGYHVSADKSEINSLSSSRVLVSGFRQTTSNESGIINVYNEPCVYLLNNFNDNIWTQKSILLPKETTSEDIDFIDPQSSVNFTSSDFNFFGKSTSINKNVIVIGSPSDIYYNEFSSSTGEKSIQHDRGSAYIYFTNNYKDTPHYIKKVFGGQNVLKDNFFGISVDVYKNSNNINIIAIGSPRSDYNLSTEYISSSIYKEIPNIVNGYPNEESFNGQVILYYVDDKRCAEYISEYKDQIDIKYYTSHPINSRKEYGKPYQSFGYSVDISELNITVGTPLNEMYCISCDHNGDKETEVFQSDNENDSEEFVLLFDEDKPIIKELQGRCYVYNFRDFVDNYNIGNVFYNNNKLIINTSGNILKNIISEPQFDNHYELYGSMKGKMHLHEVQYICTVEPGEFNTSTNLTAREMESFEYRITNRFKFLFEDLDYILRYINLRINKTEDWWNYVIEKEDDGVEQSIFDYYCLNKNITNNLNKLQNYQKLYNYIENNFDLDLNEDGLVNLTDAIILWKYFINQLTVENYKEYLSFSSKLNSYDVLIQKLDKYTGKNYSFKLNKEFFNYNQYSQNDVTGSYLAPYITQVGLYNNADLLAIAKLGNPIKNTGEIPLNFVVKFDY